MQVTRRTTVKSKLAVLVMIGLIAGLGLADGAAAGWFNKKPHEKESQRPPRFNRYPTMEFATGVLHRDGPSGWVVDGQHLALHSSCRVEDYKGQGGARALREGATVLIMGNNVGGSLIAYRIIVRKPDWDGPGSTTTFGDQQGEVQIVWSTSDPSVGCGDAPK